MKPFRIGLIGAGWISRSYVAALTDVDEGRVVGVCARHRASAERFAKEFNLELATDSLDELLPQVDVVCVNSPNALHAEHAMAAARAGKHVIVEKPLAVSLEEAEAMIQTCRDAGVGLAYAEELPFVPKFEKAREVIASGQLGEIFYVPQREAHHGPHSPWFFSRDEAGGGVLMDMACHSIECVRWLLGKPACRSVQAELARTLHRDRTELEDHGVVHLEFEGGVTALCEASWALQGGMQSTLEVWGSLGTLRVDLLHETGMKLYRSAGEGVSPENVGWQPLLADSIRENGYPQELRHFLRAFQAGSPPREGGEDGLRVLEILYAAYASAREGRRVRLPFAPAGVARAVDLWLGSPS